MLVRWKTLKKKQVKGNGQEDRKVEPKQKIRYETTNRFKNS